MFQDMLALGSGGSSGGTLKLDGVWSVNPSPTQTWVADKDYALVVDLFQTNGEAHLSYITKNGTNNNYDYVVQGQQIGNAVGTMGYANVTIPRFICYNDIKKDDVISTSTSSFMHIILAFTLE